MRFWVAGPRLFGGMIRPGISFGVGALLTSQQSHDFSKGEFVYIVTGDHGRVKIGITKNPEARLASLQTGSHVRLSMPFTTWAGDRALDVEQTAHSLLRHRWVSGEWFNATREEAIAAIYAAAAKTGTALDRAPMAAPRFQIHWLWWVIIAWVAIGILMRIFG